MKNSQILLIGAIGIGAYLYFKKNNTINLVDSTLDGNTIATLTPAIPESNEPTQVFGGGLPQIGTSVILPKPLDVIAKPTSTPVIPVTPIKPILKGYTWAYNSGATHSIACSQGAGRTLYSVDENMVSGQTVYVDSAGSTVFNGGNTYWKKYVGAKNQTMMISNNGSVSDVRSC